jgi:molybdenum cofactor guanylyltransferase
MERDYDVAGVTGVILAGGRSRRMGGGTNKALLPLDGRPMLAHVIERLSPQVGNVLLVINGDPTGFQAFGLPLVTDPMGDYAGPLAGLLAGMIWARERRPETRWIATTPCDTPFLPEHYVGALLEAAGADADTIVIAASEGRSHFVSGLWPLALQQDLAAWLEAGEHKMQHWIERHPHREVSFARLGSGEGAIDPFFNVNTPEDFAMAEHFMRQGRT